MTTILDTYAIERQHRGDWLLQRRVKAESLAVLADNFIEECNRWAMYSRINSDGMVTLRFKSSDGKFWTFRLRVSQ